jgi:hypothetical protein
VEMSSERDLQSTKARQRMPPPLRSIDLKDKIKIVKAHDWLAVGGTRRREPMDCTGPSCECGIDDAEAQPVLLPE